MPCLKTVLNYAAKPTLLAALTVAIFCFVYSTKAIAVSSSKLFEFKSESANHKATPASPQMSGSRRIILNKSLTELAVGDTIEVPLSSSDSLVLLIKTRWLAKNGDLQLTASYADDGTAIITIGPGTLFASLSSKHGSYSISLDEQHHAVLIDHTQSNHVIDLGDDIMQADGSDSTSPSDRQAKQSDLQKSSKATAQNKAVVSILIVYSAEFSAGFSNPESRINQMIAFSNQAYQRSGIHIDLQLAHSAQIGFNNSADIGTLLRQATDGTGSFSQLHALRDSYYADIVAVLPFTGNRGVAGVAWIAGDRDRLAFSVSQFARWGSDAVFAHEIGHNLGSGHERLSANPNQRSACSGGFTGYACGHGNGSEGTIMSYLNDRAWNFVFSNPNLDCDNEPCGIAQGRPNAADNSTSFNISAPLIEQFRVDTSNDDDKDGVKNDVDNCASVSNPRQVDTDNDRLGDRCDNDDDDDGRSDSVDNCPLVANPRQLDSDRDGIGDECDSGDLCFPVKKDQSVMLLCF